MDITSTLAPKSDQLDAVDLLSGPQTFTIDKVGKNASPDQPVNVHLVEFPRVWRPGKSMRRVLAACWGADASQWTGRRVTLYCDTRVKFGGEEVGGTRISHLSHIDKAMKVPLIVTRGKSQVYTVQPLVEKPAPKATTAGADIDALARAFEAAGVAQNLWLDYCTNVVGRTITAPTDLTDDEGRKVIAALQQDTEAGDRDE